MSGSPIGAQVEVWAPAKLNLFLEILAHRSDGYHEVVTVMTGISLYDTLLFQPESDQQISFTARWCAQSLISAERGCQPLGDLPVGNDNLVVKALRLIRKESGHPGGARLELTKRIPSQAGLGGASSDAAATLLAANLGWRLGWPLERLKKLAAKLGSDVPFFLRGGTGICKGRGEKVHWLGSGTRLHCVVVRPPDGLNTAEVYRQLKVPDDDRQHSLGDCFDHQASPRIIGAQLFNRLQPTAEACAPALSVVKSHFQQTPFVGHQLSGSGSSYFGVSANLADAQRWARRLRATRIGQTFQVTSNCQVKLISRIPPTHSQ